MCKNKDLSIYLAPIEMVKRGKAKKLIARIAYSEICFTRKLQINETIDLMDCGRRVGALNEQEKEMLFGFKQFTRFSLQSCHIHICNSNGNNNSNNESLLELYNT